MLLKQNGTITMAIRRIASYLGATAAALALALAPSIASAAGPFNHLEVGGVTPTAAGVTFNGVGKAPITANIPGMGVLTCSAATASGKVYAADIRITSIALTCPPIIAGSTVTVAVDAAQCPNGIIWTPTPGQTVDRMASATNPTGYAGPYNNPVTGTTNFGTFSTNPQNACVIVTFKIFGTTVCTFKLAGNVASTLDETPKGTLPAISQQLNLGGNLTVGGATGALCPIGDGTIIALSVPLNITVPGSTNPPLIDAVP